MKQRRHIVEAERELHNKLLFSVYVDNLIILTICADIYGFPMTK